MLTTAHKSFTANYMFQKRRPNCSLTHCCIMSKTVEESMDHLFLCCLSALALWHRLFELVGICWVAPPSSTHMLLNDYLKVVLDYLVRSGFLRHLFGT